MTDLQELAKEVSSLNDQLNELRANKVVIDTKIDEAIGPLKLQKDEVEKSIVSIHSLIKDVSEKLARFELEEAANTIEQAEKDAIAAVEKYNSMFIKLKDNNMIKEDDYNSGTFALLKSRHPSSDDKAWLSEYSCKVVEYVNGWFPSEINC